MIKEFSGAVHQVHTACLLRSMHDEKMIVSKTDVTFYDLTEKDIESYLQTDDFSDKAGGYGIQSYGALLVKEIKGDYNTVVGLPLAEVVHTLKEWQE